MNPTDQEIRRLRESIEATRERISHEMEELGNLLTPEHAKEIAKEKMVEAKGRAIEGAQNSARAMAETARETGRRFGRGVADNPVPIAMMSVGAGWLLWNAMRARRHRPDGEARAAYPGEMGETHGRERGHARETSSSMRERVGSAATSVRHRAQVSTSSARERGSDLAVRGRHRAQRSWDRTYEGFDANPIAFGLAALVLGTGIGMLLPHTMKEDRALGERRQRIVSRARQRAEEAKDVAIRSAKEGLRSARDTARQETEKREELPPHS